MKTTFDAIILLNTFGYHVLLITEPFVLKPVVSKRFS
jgi:hypothetical protein